MAWELEGDTEPLNPGDYDGSVWRYRLSGGGAIRGLGFGEVSEGHAMPRQER